MLTSPYYIIYIRDVCAKDVPGKSDNNKLDKESQKLDKQFLLYKDIKIQYIKISYSPLQLNVPTSLCMSLNSLLYFFLDVTSGKQLL